MKLCPTPHRAISIKQLGTIKHGKPDIVFISGHDGDPAKFIADRRKMLLGFLHDSDTEDHLEKCLEIDRDTNATDTMERTAEALFELSEGALAIQLIQFKWPRAVIDVNRWLFHNAFGDLWSGDLTGNESYGQFIEEMEQAHKRWTECMQGYLSVGCPALDWHTMGPYPASLKTGSFEEYIKGYHRIPLVDHICVMTGVNGNSNVDLIQSLTDQCGPDSFVKNEPYGAGERFKICTANMLMDMHPGKFAGLDIPKRLVESEEERASLAEQFAMGLWNYLRKK